MTGLTLAVLPTAAGFALAHQTWAGDGPSDAAGRPLAVLVGARRYAARRTAETVATLCLVALVRSTYAGGRVGPDRPNAPSNG